MSAKLLPTCTIRWTVFLAFKSFICIIMNNLSKLAVLLWLFIMIYHHIINSGLIIVSLGDFIW